MVAWKLDVAKGIGHRTMKELLSSANKNDCIHNWVAIEFKNFKYGDIFVGNPDLGPVDGSNFKLTDVICCDSRRRYLGSMQWAFIRGVCN